MALAILLFKVLTIQSIGMPDDVSIRFPAPLFCLGYQTGLCSLRKNLGDFGTLKSQISFVRLTVASGKISSPVR